MHYAELLPSMQLFYESATGRRATAAQVEDMALHIIDTEVDEAPLSAWLVHFFADVAAGEPKWHRSTNRREVCNEGAGEFTTLIGWLSELSGCTWDNDGEVAVLSHPKATALLYFVDGTGWQYRITPVGA